MPKFKLEEFLLPWEIDADGKKLEEPKEIDVEQLRKYVYGLLEDKEKAQEARDIAATEKAQVQDQLNTVLQEHENDEQRRAREEKEREQRYAALEKDAQERKKLDALAEAFPDATSARLKKLAKRVTGDEKDWVADATELVEDGFKISDKPVEQQVTDDDGDDLSVTPRARRNGQVVVPEVKKTKQSPADELAAAGIGGNHW